MFPYTSWKRKIVLWNNAKAARIEKYPMTWSSITHYLKTAALMPQKRHELISGALQQLLASIPAAGAALIWPCANRKMPWKIYYAGIRPNTMLRWLSARLDSAPDVMIGMLQHDLASGPYDMPPPLFMQLHTPHFFLRGLLIIWAALPPESLLADPLNEGIERVHQTLEALLEVKEVEEDFFSTSSPLCDRELLESLAHDDTSAMSTFLGLARVVGKADFTFWARAYQDVVEITGHLGAIHSGFGFALPRGHGVGGRVAASGMPMFRGDYLNSPYREPRVSDIIDGEQIRSGMALPVRYTANQDHTSHVAAVLYATRRTATPFTLAECLLVQRMSCLLEPLPMTSRPTTFPSLSLPARTDQKVAWYDIVLHANRIEPLETWVGQYIKGTVIVTDSDGNPYEFAHSDDLENMKAACNSQSGAPQTLSLAAPGVSLPGQVYLCSSIPLPPPQWPDFFADLVLACNLIIARMDQAQDHLIRQREHWLHTLLQGKSLQYVEQDGYRLGLPIEHGQVWVLIWSQEAMQAMKSARKRMIAESIVLDTLKSPLIFCEDTLAVVLLEGTQQSPSKVRDTLLKHCGGYPLWVVHGVHYRSFHELKTTITHAISLARKACRDKYGEYLLDIYTFGLDSLLENPRLAEDLDTFATKLLTPLIDYDAAHGSHLTETFVLAQTLGSAQAAAEHLAVHVNTIRYRLHRVEDVLGLPQASPTEHTAMSLAAFIWKHFHMTEQVSA